MIRNLVLCCIVLFSTSCTVGVKEKHTIVISSIGQHPEEASGFIRVATNKPVPVVVNDIHTTLDIGGYYVIHVKDLKTLLEQDNVTTER